MSLRGEDGWHATHSAVFGQERWEALHQAMQRDTEHVSVLNPFLAAQAQEQIKGEYRMQRTTIPFAYSFQIPEQESEAFQVIEEQGSDTIFVESAADTTAVGSIPRPAPFFFIDGGAVIVALSLRAEQEDRVLDMCSSPGGKALVVASTMFAKAFQGPSFQGVRGRLVCNEVSKPKAQAVQARMTAFLPPQLFSSTQPNGPNVVFSAVDAMTPHNTMERLGPYDRILLDAPCTSDKTMLRGGAMHMGKWSTGTPKVNSEKQLKLLHNALWLLREGGILLFTCTSLHVKECDEVIERLLMKAKHNFVLEVLSLEEDIRCMVPLLNAEHTDWGTRIMPDKTPYGPLYFSRIRMLKRTHEAAMPC